MIRIDQLNQFGSLFSEGVETQSAPTFEQRLAARRAALEEDFLVTLMRWTCDAAHLVSPAHLSALPAVAKSLLRRDSATRDASPDVLYLRPAGNGFVAAASDLTPPALLDAYSRGFVLRWIAGSPVWWSPAWRTAGAPAHAQEPRDAVDLLAGGGITITVDREFDLVASTCARRAVLRGRPFQPCRDGLEIMARMHDAGFAHSVEIRGKRDRLIAGCYGIASGRAFITQARFGVSKAAADLAVIMLNRHLAYWNFTYHDLCSDCGAADFGFTAQGRDDAQTCLTGSIAGDRRGRWLAVGELCQ